MSAPAPNANNKLKVMDVCQACLVLPAAPADEQQNASSSSPQEEAEQHNDIRDVAFADAVDGEEPDRKRRDLKAEAKSSAHLMTHYPKNK